MIVIADTSGIVAAADQDVAEWADCQKVLESASTVVLSPLVLAEIDHLAKARFGFARRTEIIAFILEQRRRLRFHIPDTDMEILETAWSICGKYQGLNVDFADAVNVALAQVYNTNQILTLDRRDFRAIRPLTRHDAFRLLPDDL